MSESEAQLDRLARRINFLERFRRPLSIVLAALMSPLVIWWFSGWLPDQWPGAHMAAMAICIAVFAWYAIETFFGFLMALWETDYSKLTRSVGLPRAELVRRK
jgi:uncharacterized BrkB/YihY/UPF0761 family membrane protein